MRFWASPLLAAAVLPGLVWGQAAASASGSAFDKAVLEGYVRHLFVWGPQIKVSVSDPKPSELPGFKEVSVTASAGQAVQQETFYVSSDGRRFIRGSVYDITQSPFRSELGKLTTEGFPSVGPADAPVVIVMYSDFECGYCREEAKVIRIQLVKEYPSQVRLLFKDFPLEPIHPWAKPAAIAGRCFFRQRPEAFWDYHDWIFEKQGEITPENLKAKIEEFARAKNLEAVLNCFDSRATEDEVNRSMAEARSVGVNSTPTIFVNGRRMVGNVPWPQLKQVIDHELAYKKNHGGDKCCEVKLPGPLNQ